MNNIEALKNKPKISKYLQQNPINSEQGLLWIICALEQGRDLIDDSMLLHKSKRHGSAFNLMCLGLEELAKSRIILEYMIEINSSKNKQSVWQKTKKRLLSHEIKIESIFSSAFKIIDTKTTTQKKAHQILDKLEINPINALTKIRELSTYTTAWSDGVLTPEKHNKTFRTLPPLIKTTTDHYFEKAVDPFKKVFSHLYALGLKVKCSKKESTYSKYLDAFNSEAKKVIYFVNFTCKYFDNYQTPFIALCKSPRKSQDIIDLIHERSYRRKIRVLFEVLSAIQKERNIKNDALLIKAMFSKKLKNDSHAIFQEAKRKGYLY